MKQSFLWLFPIALVFLLGQTPLLAQEDVKARIEAMEKELQLLKASLTQQGEKATRDQALIAELQQKDELQAKKLEEISKAHEQLEKQFTLEEFYGPRVAEEFAKKGLGPQFGGIYTKPFLRRFGRNTYLGGYTDASYRTVDGANDRFETIRFVPFIYSDISDRIKMATELEIEHGGIVGAGDITTAATGQNVRLGGDVKLEFATIDFLLRDEVNFRGGYILVPLGKYNLVHDAPIQDLVDRPLVDTFIIPTTMTEAGMGFFGTFYPTEMSKLDYEVYITQGIKGMDRIAGTDRVFFNSVSGTRGGRGRSFFRMDEDNNENKAIVGRVAFSPFLGLEIGGSAYHGAWDALRAGRRSSRNITISALDFVWQKGPFELVGTGAYADIEKNGIDRIMGLTSPTTKVPKRLFGYYVEPRYHFMPGFLHDFMPTIFTDHSTFTLSTRWEQMDLDRGNRQDRLTLGLNFRYTEDTVFKLDYQINREHFQRGFPAIGQSGSINNNALIFGVATYF
jgi:hypothetical protein